MPTRVVLRERPPEPSTAGRRIGMRSSFSIKNFTRENERQEQVPPPRPASDIGSSPRLLGYLFTWIASGVMLVTVLQFFGNGDTTTTRRQRHLETQARGNSTDPTDGNDDLVDTPFDASVLRWKLYGALAVSIFGITFYLLVMVAHLDTVLFPKLWKSVFQDGSRHERNLLYFLILFWSAALHICTSTFSVGYVQANVYFTCWICFFATCFNLDVWRASANLPTIGSQKPRRETTRNWAWTCIFSLTTTLALADVYSNRDKLVFYVKGEVFNPPRTEWIRGMSLTFGTCMLSAAVILANATLDFSYQITVCSTELFILDWKFCEGFVIFGILGIWGWMTDRYTGVSGALNGPGNAYFGVWCTFFSAVFTLGSWMKELGVVDMDDSNEE
jgi:hypothetical protein